MNFLDPYKWLIGLVLAAVLAAGAWFVWWHHGHVQFNAGIAAQRAAEAKSLAVYTQARDAQLASAEASYHAEIDNLRLHPVVLGPVRLREYVPSGAGQDAATCGASSAAAATGRVSGVHAPGGQVRGRPGADIGGLLAAYAAAADRLSAQLRALENAAK